MWVLATRASGLVMQAMGQRIVRHRRIPWQRARCLGISDLIFNHYPVGLHGLWIADGFADCGLRGLWIAGFAGRLKFCISG